MMKKTLKEQSAASVFQLLSEEILNLRNATTLPSPEKLKHKYTLWHGKVEKSFRKFNVPSDLRKNFYGIALDPNDELFAFSISTGTAKLFNDLSCVLLKISELLARTTNQKNLGERVEMIYNIINKFHLVRRQLEERHDERETLDVRDEYDVQDLFHALLRLYFDDIRAEEWTPSYAGSSSRIDFLIPNLKLAIEIKMTRKGLANKEAGSQLAIDKDHYRIHPDVTHLICFVYDPDGRIKNPRGFEKDLAQNGPLKTDVFVKP